jgi:propanol-preferring alcohol dehydrogenase
MKLGATAFVDFSTTKDLVKEIQDAAQGLGPHAAVIVATHESAFKQAVDYLRPGGTMVCVGLPNAALAANTFWTVFKSIRIQGSYVGNRQDASEALQLAADGKVTVHYQLKGLDKLKE